MKLVWLVSAFAAVLLACGNRPARDAPEPQVAERWRAGCETAFAAAERQAAATYGVRFERPVHDKASPDPDALRFVSANGLELAHTIEANHAPGTTTLVIEAHDGSWTFNRYLLDGFDVVHYEASRGNLWIRFELFASDTPEWTTRVNGIIGVLKTAGETCLAKARTRPA